MWLVAVKLDGKVQIYPPVHRKQRDRVTEESQWEIQTVQILWDKQPGFPNK